MLLPPDLYAKAKAGGDRQAMKDVLRVAQLLDKRAKRGSRKNFDYFFSRTTPFAPEPMQSHMGKLIEGIAIHGQTGLRELIHKPPQHGGSITMTQEQVPFYLGHNPEKRVRLLTYNVTHSEHFSDTIIRIMQSDEYKEIFPNKDCWLTPRVRAGEWSTNLRASINDSQYSFMALGLQTGFVGSGSDLTIIDDAYANDKEPFSETINLGIRKTFNEVVTTRSNPETNVIVMAHSWNDKDLRAWLIKQGGWNDTRYAAICDSENDPLGREIGESLSKRYPAEYLMRLKEGGIDKDGNVIQGMGVPAFNSLYQGNGMSRDGSLVKLEWFDYVKDFQRASNGFFLRYWDWASSAQPTADRTAGCLMYKNPIGKYTGIDLSYGRFSPGDRNKFMENTMRSDNEKYGHIAKVIQVIEAPSVSVEIVTGIRKYLAEKGFTTVPDPKTTTKESRAEALYTQMELGNVSYLEGSWNQPMQEEMLGFPNAEHDDMCLSGDTLITTKRGRIKIVSVNKGDYVLTRNGYKKVLWSGCTNPNTKTVIAKLSNGKIIKATHNHPIYTNECGFLELDSVSGALHSLCQEPIISQIKQNRLFLTVSNTIDTLTARMPLIVDILVVQKDATKKAIRLFIGKCTNSILGKFPKDFISTIKTGIRLIMTSGILNASLHRNMAIGIRGEHTKGWTSTLKRLDRSLRNGILPPKAESGIDCMELKHRKKFSLRNMFAFSAAKNSKRRMSALNIVRAYAQTDNGQKMENEKRKKNAPFAIKSILDFLDKKRAPIHVVQVKNGDIEPVYNLEVEDEHEFFANGILVHNCDAASGAYHWCNKIRIT